MRRRPDFRIDRLSPELELLVCCARLQVNARHEARIASLAGRPLDWDRFLKIATAQGIAPLVFKHVSELGLSNVPPEIINQLRLAFERSTQYNLALLKELYDLLDLFDSHGIPVICYKGPVLALQLYKHPGLRPCRDLDIVVRKRDVVRAIELLLGREYRDLRRPYGIEYELKHACEREMTRADGRIVELHWAFMPRFCSVSLDLTEVWQCLASQSIHGRQVSVLPAETLLPILSVHGAMHRWDQLKWLCDVSLLTERLSNWESAIQLAQRMGARRMLLLAVELARSVLGTALPEEVREAIRAEAALAGLVRMVGAQLHRRPGHRTDFLEEHWFWLCARQHMSDRVRYLARHAARPSSSDREFLKLPAALEFLYPGVKAIRIGIRVVSEVIAARNRMPRAN